MAPPGEPTRMSRRFLGGLIGLALLGFALRLTYGFLAEVPRGLGDDLWYHEIANEIFGGRGFSHPFESQTADGRVFGLEGEPIPTAFHPPLFPLVLAVFSELGLTSYTAHQGVGCALGGGTVAMLGLAGRQLGGERLGLMAAAMAAVFLPLVVKDSMLMTESLYGLLVALSLLMALCYCAAPSPRTAALLGALIGLAALTRGEALAMAVLLAPVIVTAGGRGPGSRHWRSLAALVAALLIVIAPWSIRNTLTFDEPVLVTTVDGSVIAGANHPTTYRGHLLGAWDFEALGGPDRRPGVVNEAVQSRRWRRQGIEYARDHASRLPLVALVRIARTWSLYPIGPLERAQFAAFVYKYIRVVEPFSNAMLYVAVLLAAIGGLSLRRRRSELWVLVAPVVLVTLVSVFAFGDPRFRHAADVALPLLAAVGLARLLERRRRPAPATA
jgi:Dolichyl-phosphate-mannose-protein mannosyltransferase